MKNRILPMTLVASAGLLTGCAHNSEYSSSSDDRHRTGSSSDMSDHSRSGTYATATQPSTTPTPATSTTGRTTTTTPASTTPTSSVRTTERSTTVASGQSPTNEWFDTNRDVVMSPSGEVRELDRSGESTTRVASGSDRMDDGARTAQPSQPTATPSSQPVTSSSTTRSSTAQPSGTPTSTPLSGAYATGQTRDPNRATDQYGSSDHSGPAPTTDTTTARSSEPARSEYKSESTKAEAARTDTSKAQPAKTEYSKTETTDMQYAKETHSTTSKTTDRTRTGDHAARHDRDAGRYREVAYTPVVKTNDAFGSSPYSPANMGRTTADYDPRGIEPITREGVAVAPASAAQPTSTTWVVGSDKQDTRGSAPYTPANRGVDTSAEDVRTASAPVTGTMSDGRVVTDSRGATSTTTTDETRRRHVDAMASQQGQPATAQRDWNQPNQPIDPGQPAVAAAQPDRTQPGVDRRVQPDRANPADRTAQPMTDAFAAATAETRILSILQAKDQEEIEIGKLAQQRGKSEAVRQYGQTLERDHSEHLEKVRSTAQSSGVTLLTAEQTRAAMKLEKERRPDLYGMPMDPAHMTDKDMKPVDKDGKPQWDDTHKDPSDVRKEQPTSSNPTKDQPSDATRGTPDSRIREGGSPRQDGRDSAYGRDVLEELRAAEGDRFDAVFAEKMHKGHGKVIRIVEDAQKKVSDPAVRDLLAKTLPTLREHERLAMQLTQQTGQREPGQQPTDRPAPEPRQPKNPR